MYISEILKYLLWPALILMSWFAVSIALAWYEKRYKEKK